MQKAIALKKVEYSYGEKPILSGVSFQCTEKERLCLFGENGAGKSTLLKILCDQIKPDAGVVEKTGHIRSVYVSQEFEAHHKAMTVHTYIETEAGIALEKKVYATALELGFDAEQYKDMLSGSLSGGQQKILALSVAFALSPDFIFLDEPENHIDIVSRVILMRMLQEFRGGIVFISHDRLIIDSVATKVAELAHGKLHISEGGYEDYIESKMARIGGLQRQYDSETKRINQLSASLAILHQKAIRGKEVSAYQRKKKELDDLKLAHKESGRPDDEKTKIRIHQNEKGLHGGKLLCRMKDGAFKYENAKADTFRDAFLEMRSGSKVVLLGRNGSGKSTFLKALMGEYPLGTGELTWTDGIKRAYFDQHAVFDPAARCIEIVCEKLNCLETEGRAVLGAMRFDSDRMMASAGSLSGGERMRLRFAIVFGLKPDLIILDEPTNHLDEVTWEILLEACSKSKSTILLVSHDYEFIEEFNPDVFWMMHNQTVVPRYKELSFLLEEMGS